MSNNKLINVLISTTLLLQVTVHCQNSLESEENVGNSLPSSTTSPSSTHGLNTPITVAIVQSNEENTVPTSKVFLSTIHENIVGSPKIPTVLHEATTKLASPNNRNRDRNRNRNRGGNTRNLARGRNFLDPNRNNPDKVFFRRLVRLGSRFVARSLALVTGNDPQIESSSEDRFRNFDENAEFSSSIGAVQNSSQEENQQFFNNKWRNANPAQFLQSRFIIKQNKMQRWREVKDDFRRKELERRVDFFNDNSGDVITRNARNVIRSLVNRFEKNTETMQLWVDYRRQRLQRFLQLPLVSSILKNNTASVTEDNNSTGISSSTSSNEDDQDEVREVDDASNDDYRPFSPIADISRKVMRFIQSF